MFVKASRLKLRFESSRGLLSVEDLWTLPLSSNTKESLNGLAVALHKQLKDESEFSLETVDKKVNEITQLKFDIVKYIYDVRSEEAANALKAKINHEKKQEIMELIKRKENEELNSSSVDDLRKLLDTL